MDENGIVLPQNCEKMLRTPSSDDIVPVDDAEK